MEAKRIYLINCICDNSRLLWSNLKNVFPEVLFLLESAKNLYKVVENIRLDEYDYYETFQNVRVDVWNI